MKRLAALIIVVAFSTLGIFHTAYAAGREDAKALVEKAYAYLKENAKPEAFTEISNPNGQFVKEGLYVFVLDFKGKNLADGGNPDLVGNNHLGFKDTNGKYFVKEMIRIAKSKGEGWVEYMWLNPNTKKIQPKITYVKRIKGTDALMGSGVLK